MDREVLEHIKSECEWLSAKPQQMQNTVVTRHALRCFSFVNDFLIHAHSNRATEVVALKAARICVVLAASCNQRGSFEIELPAKRLVVGENSAAFAGMLARHPLGLAGFQSILTASEAIQTFDFRRNLEESLITSSELDDSVAAGFFSDVDVLKRGVPFSDGTSFSDGTGFAVSAEELYAFKLWGAAPLQVRHFATPGQSNPWKFWEEWHKAFWQGMPLSSSLQSKVVRIADSIWDAGPEAVAKEIERIRREMAGPAPLEREKLLTHVKHLLANPVMTESAALSAAETVERAIRAYKDEAPANCLPEGLEHLEDLPGHFRVIAKVVADPATSEDKEEELRQEIENLHAKVVKLEQDLVEARSKTLKGVMSTKAAEKLGTTLGNPVFYGGIAMGVGYFFGVTPSDMTFENLRGFIQELTSANAEAPVAPILGLPLVHDI